MNILAFLQNQWFHDPVKGREIMARHEQDRSALIRKFLFAGKCRTSQVLLKHFGEACKKWTWEESTREITGYPQKVFPADPQHMLDVILKVTPGVIITFGFMAEMGLRPILYHIPSATTTISLPHPAWGNQATVARRFTDAAATLARLDQEERAKIPVRKGPKLSEIEPTAEERAEYAELEAWAERSRIGTAKLILGVPQSL